MFNDDGLGAAMAASANREAAQKANDQVAVLSKKISVALQIIESLAADISEINERLEKLEKR